jgi:hypothetical protein
MGKSTIFHKAFTGERITKVPGVINQREGKFMKIVSKAVLTAALLIGVGAFMHPITASALPPCSTCATWWQECSAGNQAACKEFGALCMGCPEHSTVSGAPPVNSNKDAGVAALNSHRGLAVAK